MHAPGRTALIFGVPATGDFITNNGRRVELIELLPMGHGSVSVLPDYPPISVNVKEPTWVVEGIDQLEVVAMNFFLERKVITVPCLPIPQKYLLIIGDGDGNPVSEHHDIPYKEPETTS